MPDLLFPLVGIVSLFAAAIVLIRSLRQKDWSKWPAALFWVLFGTGILVQASAPRLKIEHNSFVVPSSFATANHPLDPVAIVGRERRMQLLSAALTVAGALGLAWSYRSAFSRPRSESSTV